MNRNQTGGDSTGGFPKGIPELIPAQASVNLASNPQGHDLGIESHLFDAHAIGGSTDRDAGRRGLGCYNNHPLR